MQPTSHLFGFVVAVLVGYIIGRDPIGLSGVSSLLSRGPSATDGVDNVEASQAKILVKRAFLHAWNGYRRYAWGHDGLKPLSQNHSNTFGGLGLTIVDALDTALIMGLSEEYQQGRAWIQTSLDFDRAGAEVSFFETTIRFLGGLLSTYYLTGDSLFLQKSIDLGDRLIGSFDSALGFPYPSLNLTTGTPNRTHTVTSFADVGSCQLEFGALSRLTGNSMYRNFSERAAQVARNQFDTFDGLRPNRIRMDQADQDGRYTLSDGIDSFYEYLLKRYIQLGAWGEDLPLQQMYGEDYSAMVAGMERHLIVHGRNLVHLSDWNHLKTKVSHYMHHLSCCTPGMLALGSLHIGNRNRRRKSLQLAEHLCETCYRMYSTVNETGLAAELVAFPLDGRSDLELAFDNQHKLRPETIESIYTLFKVTGKEKYRRWGWNIFQAWEQHAKIPEGGYSGLEDVTIPKSYNDVQESFFLSESLKYLYLLFDDDNKVDLENWVFNTEAHPLSLDPQWTPERAQSQLENLLGLG
ncbi:hypothetical protein BSKO_02172 [Bryopsis sp. KO-2023]|nr:hypothetical protein BSKO_02172 [Bryopsis sp. KO-2023]